MKLSEATCLSPRASNIHAPNDQLLSSFPKDKGKQLEDLSTCFTHAWDQEDLLPSTGSRWPLRAHDFDQQEE